MKQPIIPAYTFIDRGVPRLAFTCPHCGGLHWHGDIGGVIEMRGNDKPGCPLGPSYTMLIVGAVRSLDDLPPLPPGRAARVINLLTEKLGT